ncbi:MAG TPA: FtsX-like permease family protein [Candidatus Saccharimonadales bacterium]|nr:FtsX-like permease family protein [Candidatus Saccharimonadales bacterium]
MNPISRGIRNTFRNGVRTASVVVILALTIGLCLTMLVAQKAVGNKIASVKSSIGNTISVSPAGFSPGSTANNALSTSSLSAVSSLAHVNSVTETLTDRQSTTGSADMGFGRFGSSNDNSNSTTTSLSSPVSIDSKGPRFFAGGSDSSGNTTMSFSLPIEFLGTTRSDNIGGIAITLKSGKDFSGSADTNNALISSAMATKNNLKVGDTFTAYNAVLTVAGIFTDAGNNQRVNNTVILSLAALQRLSGQSGIVTNATVMVDSLDNLSSVTSAVKHTLGSGADVTSAQEQADNTIAPLNSVHTIATFSLIGAVVAGAIIILLVMVMIVRERKREIGVVKAIGGSNARIISEFMVESLTLTVLGAVIGLLIGIVGGQPVTKMLVSNSTSSSGNASLQGPGGQVVSISGGKAPVGAPGGGLRSLRSNAASQSLNNIKTQVGPGILLDGFGAAVVIAVLGSALAAGMISRVRPSNIMRTA